MRSLSGDHDSTGYVNAFRLRSERRGTALVLRLSGDFDWGTIGHVEAALDDAMRVPTRHVVFDLRSVTFLDAAALSNNARAARTTNIRMASSPGLSAHRLAEKGRG